MKTELEKIQKMIYEIRGQKVMLDSDLAALYDVPTHRLNEAVKRNIKRFPSEFMFQLTDNEWNFLRSQIAISKGRRGGRQYFPYAFTEHGVLMLSSVLNSDRAIDVNIKIMKVFVHMRQYVLNHKGTEMQISELQKLLMLHIENTENKFSENDAMIRQIVHALNNLIEKPKETKQIGFGK